MIEGFFYLIVCTDCGCDLYVCLALFLVSFLNSINLICMFLLEEYFPNSLLVGGSDSRKVRSTNRSGGSANTEKNTGIYFSRDGVYKILCFFNEVSSRKIM